jgi:hypothetical protein
LNIGWRSERRRVTQLAGLPRAGSSRQIAPDPAVGTFQSDPPGPGDPNRRGRIFFAFRNASCERHWLSVVSKRLKVSLDARLIAHAELNVAFVKESSAFVEPVTFRKDGTNGGERLRAIVFSCLVQGAQNRAIKMSPEQIAPAGIFRELNSGSCGGENQLRMRRSHHLDVTRVEQVQAEIQIDDGANDCWLSNCLS